MLSSSEDCCGLEAKILQRVCLINLKGGLHGPAGRLFIISLPFKSGHHFKCVRNYFTFALNESPIG